MSWFLWSIFAYFLNAVSILIDKLLLKRAFPHPAVFTFYTTILNGLAIFLFFIDPGLPTPFIFCAALVAGASFTAAIYSFYYFIKRNDISSAGPMVTSLTPLFVLIFASPILGEVLHGSQFIAFILILLGSVIIAHDQISSISRTTWATFGLALLTAGLFGFSHVVSKYVYVHQSFINGLAWRSVGSALGAFFLFIVPSTRTFITKDWKTARVKADLAFIFVKICGGVSFVILNYAFLTGSIAIVNALSGMQYVFLFFIALFLTRHYPHILREHLAPASLARKITSIVFLVAGTALLFVS